MTYQQPHHAEQPGQYGTQPGQFGTQPGQYAQPGQFAPGYGAPGQTPPVEPRKRSKTPLIIVGVAVAVVVALVVSLVLVSQANARREAEAAAALVDSAVASVEDLFAAIAAGDAETALTYVEVNEGGTELMTNEVLAVSAELAAITEVVVTPPAEIAETTMSSEITVSYLLGDTPVQQTYQVRDSERDGTWVVDGVVADGSFNGAFDGVDVTINGVPVTAESLALLPGTYEVGTTTPYITVSGGPTFQVTELYSVELHQLDPALTEEGVAAFRTAVGAAVDACVASTTLAAGCGLTLPGSFSDGTVLVEGTIVRTVSTDARTTIESMTPTLSSANPTLAMGDLLGAVDVVVGCSKDGQTGTCDVVFAPSLGAPAILMTDPELTVQWD